MFYIVEKEDKLESLERLSKLGVYVDVIPTNNLYHPKLTTTVAVYIRLTGSQHGYIVPIDHDEGLNTTKERVSRILSSSSKVYTLNKKELLYHFNIQGAIDLSLLYSMNKHNRLEYSRDTNIINQFYNKYSEFKDVNKLIPISKLYESCESVYDQVKHIIEFKIPDNFDFYNKTATNVFYIIEQSGLGVYHKEYNELFKPRDPLFNTVDNTVLTSYNLYNVTSRPTNAFNSVNFAAIPKSEQHRKCFHPIGDYFVELDFDGYHLRLLCEQIEYPLSNESAHTQLAKNYFGTDKISEEQYLEAKQINFQAIYGKIPEEHQHLEIFQKIQKYIDDMWNTFEKDGVVYNTISNKAFTKSLKEMHPAKLMNYMMQSLETARNILILKEVLRYLQNKKTKLVLYTYDSFLFDFSKEDGKETLVKLQEILETDGKYPIKVKYSKDLVL